MDPITLALLVAGIAPWPARSGSESRNGFLNNASRVGGPCFAAAWRPASTASWPASSLPKTSASPLTNGQPVMIQGWKKPSANAAGSSSATTADRRNELVHVLGDVPHRPDLTATLRSRIITAVTSLRTDAPLEPFEMTVRVEGPSSDSSRASGPARADARPRQEISPRPEHQPRYIPMTPVYTLDQLTVPEATHERLLDCLAYFTVAPIVFDTWGLRAIEPNPSMAVNFRGPPGTGKTMAAHALAAHLGRPILLTRLSDLESKYHGDGPKNLVSLFADATAAQAVLFVDEAESLLSRRFSSPEQAAESAINSMRTELLMALDAFEGLVIFASNLPHSYDAAIESRLFHVDFELPTQAARREIWRRHLPPTLPTTQDVSPERLSEIEGLSGRDIKLAVISAAISAARRDRPVDLDMLTAALPPRRSEQPAGATDADPDIKDEVTARLRARLASQKTESRHQETH